MSFEITQLAGLHWIQESMRGDQTNLIAYLRSGQPISKAVREYLADELSKPAGKRFARKLRGRSVASEAKDEQLLRLAIEAKRCIAWWRFSEAIEAI